VRAAILHVISLAQFATAHTRSWAANSVNARIRLKAERDRAVQELALLREEARIKIPHGSIAVVERFILSMKTELVGRISVPMRREAFLRELCCYQERFNEQRPHTTLGGRTPNEAYFNRRPGNRRPRFEPRRHWPRGSPCAKPWAIVAGKPGDAFAIRVDFRQGRRHLPVVSLKRAA
jgi:hypothetical protein